MNILARFGLLFFMFGTVASFYYVYMTWAAGEKLVSFALMLVGACLFVLGDEK